MFSGIRLVITAVFLLVFAGSYGQQAKVDSLYREYSKTTIDTTKVNLLIGICRAYEEVNPAKGVGYAREAVELSGRVNYNKGICVGNSLIGGYYKEQLNTSLALKSFLKAAQAGEDGKLYYELSNVYNMMGIIYSNQDEHEMSLKYFMKVAKLAEQTKSMRRLAIAYNNIGISYKDLKRYPDAQKYYQKAYTIFDSLHFTRGIGSLSSNLGIINHILGDDEKALMYDERSIAAFREVHDTASESGIMANIGEIYNDEKQYQKALVYYQKAIKISEKYKTTEFKMNAFDGLSKVYANLGDYKQAYYYNKRYLALKDSLHDEEGMRQVQEMEKRLDNEKQEKEIEILKQKEEIQSLNARSQSEKLKRSSIIIYSVAGILLMVLLMSVFIYRAYRQIRRTNVELAEKKKEIQDSINYAKNIQQAMLPEVDIMGRHFSEGFGLYLPKDVVSGDFYWFNESNGSVYFAVADCTGHGVPGAFMSMIGIDKLNQSLIDKKIEDPSEILSALNISIKKALKQRDDSAASKDGMDIALCSFNKQTMQLQYAGANRPLWLLRGNEIIEYKPTKASIAGFTDNAQVFAGQNIQLQKGDIVYLFSDGFADQFGGTHKKKYMTKQLKQKLIDIHELPMTQQEAHLEKAFNDWKGNLEQVDDVMLLGIKV
ncbi:MAG: protein serine/threonine phosphatase [Bacteroidetes bacterium]|nr:protein serine/threonine phosphatase [Bacteroidota bacterium]